MKKYYIYLRTTKKYKERSYYRRKLKKVPDHLTYVGEADLTKDYFIIGSETKFEEISDLNDVVLIYKTHLGNGRYTKFEHTIQELLERAKTGILPYISFKGFAVTRQPIIKINGQKTLHSKQFNLWVGNE